MISITVDALPAMGGVDGQHSIENTNSREHSTVETGASVTSGASLPLRGQGKKKRKKKRRNKNRSGSAAMVDMREVGTGEVMGDGDERGSVLHSVAKSTVASAMPGAMPELEKEEDDLDLDLKRMKFNPNNAQDMAGVLTALHDLDVLRQKRHEEAEVQETLELVGAYIASTKKEDEEQEGGSATAELEEQRARAAEQAELARVAQEEQVVREAEGVTCLAGQPVECIWEWCMSGVKECIWESCMSGVKLPKMDTRYCMDYMHTRYCTAGLGSLDGFGSLDAIPIIGMMTTPLRPQKKNEKGSPDSVASLFGLGGGDGGSGGSGDGGSGGSGGGGELALLLLSRLES